MPGVGFADDPQDAVAPDNDAMLTDTFDGRTNFHDDSRFQSAD
jgi:hypothetical protein